MMLHFAVREESILPAGLEVPLGLRRSAALVLSGKDPVVAMNNATKKKKSHLQLMFQ